ASAIGADCVASRWPHSVQKAEFGSLCAPQDEQTGRVTVTATEGCAAAGIRWPHDVQKLADSSTSLPHDVQSAIHFAPVIRSARLRAESIKPARSYFPAAIFSTNCE
ncbi:MAG TPA: hypothetical protein VN872_07675, partial [Candidatus Acidoferrum sp.]|nr:hypothetical protein [Candidatus Acidoferrum sp.]